MMRRLAESGCMSCRGAPTDGSTVFCQPCHDRFLRTAPMIVEVPRDHERYKSGQLTGELPVSDEATNPHSKLRHSSEGNGYTTTIVLKSERSTRS